jgi:phosphoenolpyruvate-protein kinase (PTS system EI component)
LATLPALVDLKINLTTQNEAFLILNSLVNLLYLNGKSTRDETHIVDIDDKEIESVSLNNEITNFNAIFTKLSEKLKQVNKEMNKTFFEEFQSLLKNEINHINTAVDNTVPNYIYATNVLSSKIKIFKYFNSRYSDYQDIKEPGSSKLSREIVDNVIKSSENLISKLTE